MVNATPAFQHFPAVINGWSDLILEIFGDDVGSHARSAIGVAGLPWNMCVEIEAELMLKD
jgi:enamine deaminase RidA (YjgF/YER057c/UK114 family)